MHLADPHVVAFAAGVLPAGELLEAHAHIDSCDDCRRRLARALHGIDETEASRGLTLAVGTSKPAMVHEQPTAIAAPGARARRSSPAPAPAHLDEYELGALLGRGGMGSVFRARDTLLDREVAVKLLPRASTEAAQQRFLVEARAVARIRHPNVVGVHRFAIAGEQPYIVYDLVEGRTLAELARPVPWPKVVAIAVGITRGLAAAHAEGVLHRDIKPANLMLDRHDDVIVVDFGLAKVGEEAGGTSGEAPSSGDSLTAPGTTMGTPRYMAPESWRGETATARTDLYSFGVTLYELLAARTPFSELAGPELRARVIDHEPPSLATAAPWVPRSLIDLVDTCLARDPARRPSSVVELGRALELLQREQAFDRLARDGAEAVSTPYLGAQPFDSAHHAVFLGRDLERRSIVDQLHTLPLVIVAGARGVGKTSLCQAGVLPVIARGVLGGPRRWASIAIAPGPHPRTAFARALAPHLGAPPETVERWIESEPETVAARLRAGHDGGCTAHLVFVDPLDEVLEDTDEAHQVVRVLAALSGQSPTVRVLATVGVDRLPMLARIRAFASALGAGLYLLAEPATEAAWREIIAGPARRAGRPLPEDSETALVNAAVAGELSLAELAARLAAVWAS